MGRNNLDTPILGTDETRKERMKLAAAHRNWRIQLGRRRFQDVAPELLAAEVRADRTRAVARRWTSTVLLG